MSHIQEAFLVSEKICVELNNAFEFIFQINFECLIIFVAEILFLNIGLECPSSYTHSVKLLINFIQRHVIYSICIQSPKCFLNLQQI